MTATASKGGGAVTLSCTYISAYPARSTWKLSDQEKTTASESDTQWRAQSDANLENSLPTARFWAASQPNSIHKAAHANVHYDAERQKRKQHR